MQRVDQFEQLELLISCIYDLTKQRDMQSLNASFGRGVIQLTGSKSLTLFRIRSIEGKIVAVPVLQLGATAQLKTGGVLSQHKRDVDLPLNFEDLETVYAGLALPVMDSKGDLVAYCQLDTTFLSSDVRRILNDLIDVYKNLFALIEDSERDALTGLLNRKTFEERITKLLRGHQSGRSREADKTALTQVFLAVLDIDHFKRINDTFGHVYGDEVLLIFANLMTKTFREGDLLFRFGGEEFVAILTCSNSVHANAALERFRTTVENHKFPQITKVTVSTGFALFAAGEMPGSATYAADKALYFAKRNGRNQVCYYDSLVEQGLLDTPSIATGKIELF